MTQILSQMSDAVGSIASLPAVQTGTRLVAAYVVILWLGAALWAFRDMRRRTHDLIAPYASAALVVAFTPLLFPAAFLVHLVLRPPETLEERSEHELRRAILEAEAVGTSCPTCLAPTSDDWLLCPSCATRLRRRCADCDRVVELAWDVCAWCGRDFRPAHPTRSEPTVDPSFKPSPALAGSDPIPATASAGPVRRRGAPLPGRRSAAPKRSGGPHVRRQPPVPVPGVVAPVAAPFSTSSDG